MYPFCTVIFIQELTVIKFPMKQHILYNHLPWFAKKYGAPGIWSTQGLEKSHYQARGAFFRHTRRGGGRERAETVYERCLSGSTEEYL